MDENSCELCYGEFTQDNDMFLHKCGAKNHKTCLQQWIRRAINKTNGMFHLDPAELAKCQRCFGKYHRGELRNILNHDVPIVFGMGSWFDPSILQQIHHTNINDPVYKRNLSQITNIFGPMRLTRTDDNYIIHELSNRFLYEYMNYMRKGREAYSVQRPTKRHSVEDNIRLWEEYHSLSNRANPTPVLAIIDGVNVIYVRASEWDRPLKSFVPEGAKTFYLDPIDETIEATDAKYETITVEKLLEHMALIKMERELRNPGQSLSEFIHNIPVTIHYGKCNRVDGCAVQGGRASRRRERKRKQTRRRL